jgi:hypothetical protein
MEPQTPDPTVPPDQIPGSALNDGAPLHPETPAKPAEAEKPKRKKREVPDYQKPEVLAAYDAESQKLYDGMVAAIDSLYADYNDLKLEAKTAKQAWEAKRDELQALVKERKEQRGKPVQKTLVDFAPPAEEEPPPAEAMPAVPPAEPSALDELWRQYPLGRCTTFGMTEKDVEIMASGERKGGYATYPVRTMGEMADYTAGDGAHPRHIEDFRGLGASGATRISAAVENFWGWWNSTGRDEFAAERGIPVGGQTTQPDAGGGGEDHGAGDPGDATEPAGAGGPAGDDGEQVGDTVVTVEHFLNDPDAKPLSPADEDLAAVPTGDDSGTFSLGGDGEGE